MPARKNRPGKYGTPGYVRFDPTPEERLLLAIFGLKPGETTREALASMRPKEGSDA